MVSPLINLKEQLEKYIKREVQRNIIYPTVFVERYINYTSKYGLGYLLSNDTVGVYFNDHSKMYQETNNSKFATYTHKGTET